MQFPEDTSKAKATLVKLPAISPPTTPTTKPNNNTPTPKTDAYNSATRKTSTTTGYKSSASAVLRRANVLFRPKPEGISSNRS